MRILYFLAFIVFILCSSCSQRVSVEDTENYDTVKYSVRVARDAGEVKFIVDLRFPTENIASFELKRFARNVGESCEFGIYEIQNYQNIKVQSLHSSGDILLAATPTGDGPAFITYHYKPALIGRSFGLEKVLGCDPVIVAESFIYVDGRGLFPAVNGGAIFVHCSVGIMLSRAA